MCTSVANAAAYKIVGLEMGWGVEGWRCGGDGSGGMQPRGSQASGCHVWRQSEACTLWRHSWERDVTLICCGMSGYRDGGRSGNQLDIGFRISGHRARELPKKVFVGVSRWGHHENPRLILWKHLKISNGLTTLYKYKVAKLVFVWPPLEINSFCVSS